MSETQELRRRENRSNSTSSSIFEESLLATVDSFLETLEQKLDAFEYYFKFLSGANQKAKLDDNIKEFEEKLKQQLDKEDSEDFDLQSFYESLKLMKASMLNNTSSKLDTMNKFLMDNYSGLYSATSSVAGTSGSSGFLKSSSKNVHQQVSTGLEYLENKLNKIDQLIGNFQPKFTVDYLNYYNYNKAAAKGKLGYLHYFQLPFLWRENRFIIYGYRFTDNPKQLLKTIFSIPLHNESSNIWTHLLGAFYIIYLMLIHYPQSDIFAKQNSMINANVYMFLFAALNCLLSSTFYHTFTGLSNYALRSRCACVDYTGITVLISASIICAQYASLYYYDLWKVLSIGFTCSMSILGFYLSWSPAFDKTEYRPLRILFFIALACIGASCFVILSFYKGFVHSFFFFSPLFKSFACYFIGVFFYALLIPERWRSDITLDPKLPDFSSLYKQISDNAKASEAVGSEKTKEIYDMEIFHGECLDKHFLNKPVQGKNYGTWYSLWWVDYVFSSHSIWHTFVFGGILGHYFGILQMFKDIDVNQPI